MSSRSPASERRVLETLEVEISEVPEIFGLDTGFEPEELQSTEEVAGEHLSVLEQRDRQDYPGTHQGFSAVNASVYERPEVRPVEAAAYRTLAFISHDVAEDGLENIPVPRELFEEFEREEWSLAQYFLKKEGEALNAGEINMDGFHPLPDEYARAELSFYQEHDLLNNGELDEDEIDEHERNMWYDVLRSVELRFPGKGLQTAGEATEHYIRAVREGHDQRDPEAAFDNLHNFYDVLLD